MTEYRRRLLRLGYNWVGAYIYACKRIKYQRLEGLAPIDNRYELLTVIEESLAGIARNYGHEAYSL